jgi:hypothetical protein
VAARRPIPISTTRPLKAERNDDHEAPFESGPAPGHRHDPAARGGRWRGGQGIVSAASVNLSGRDLLNVQ